MLIQVRGGTGAGRRRVVEFAGWRCQCPRLLAGRCYSCGECGSRRDDASSSAVEEGATRAD